MSDLKYYWNTARHLSVEQARGRAARALRPRPRPDTSTKAVESNAWAPHVPRCDRAADPSVLNGTFRFWGVQREIDLERAWIVPELGRSWNYPVHYFDAAPALVRTRGADVQRWLERWISAHPKPNTWAWEPYPTALRIVNWIDVVARSGSTAPPAWRERVLQSIWQQADWLAKNLETHLLGTHLLKDAKALAIASLVFDDAKARAWGARARRILARELARQIRGDGSHVEPSLAYHNVALEDVLDLVNFMVGEREANAAEPIRGVGREGTTSMLRRPGGAEPVWSLDDALWERAEHMLDFAVMVATPAGEAPLLGDAGPDAAPPTRTLAAYAQRLGFEVLVPDESLTHFPPSGIAIYREPSQYFLADVGGVGASHLPGHGHCDSLSFEWWVRGRPIVVDTGTLSYERGAARAACRSTRAHNTFEIDGHEQHEMWAAFRVARRAAVTTRLGENGLESTLVPWHDRRLRVVRRFEFDEDVVRIHDIASGPGPHAITSRIHLHPDCDIERDGERIRLKQGAARAEIHVPAEARILGPTESGSVHCSEIGIGRPNAVIEIAHDGALPWRSRTELRVSR